MLEASLCLVASLTLAIAVGWLVVLVGRLYLRVESLERYMRQQEGLPPPRGATNIKQRSGV